MEDQMFNNLIESSSHTREFKRRGSFFLFTIASYALFFVIAGVVSIYAYDARMDDQDLELVTMMPLLDLPVVRPEPTTSRPSNPTRNSSNNNQTHYERAAARAGVDNPTVAPDKISTAANPHFPMPTSGVVRFTGRDVDPGVPGGTGSSNGNGNDPGVSNRVIVETPPPPLPVPKPKPPVISKGVITSEAISLPAPPYPQMAKVMHLQGKVNIQVLIDETGKVVTARALDGHPLFRQASEKAAYQARFSPTRLGDQPVKVSGVISYNFVLQ